MNIGFPADWLSAGTTPNDPLQVDFTPFIGRRLNVWNRRNLVIAGALRRRSFERRIADFAIQRELRNVNHAIRLSRSVAYTIIKGAGWSWAETVIAIILIAARCSLSA